MFFDTTAPAMKRLLSSDGQVSKGIRKPLLELTTKGQRVCLEPLISFMISLTLREKVECKTMAALALQLVSTSSGDNSTSSFCREIVSTGTFQRKVHISSCTTRNRQA